MLLTGFQLAEILNRTLILPTFWDGVQNCNLMGVVSNKCIKKLKTNLYRESVFLENSLVPSHLKHSQTTDIKLTNSKNMLSKKNIEDQFSNVTDYSILSVILTAKYKVAFKQKDIGDFKNCLTS